MGLPFTRTVPLLFPCSLFPPFSAVPYGLDGWEGGAQLCLFNCLPGTPGLLDQSPAPSQLPRLEREGLSRAPPTGSGLRQDWNPGLHFLAWGLRHWIKAISLNLLEDQSCGRFCLFQMELNFSLPRKRASFATAALWNTPGEMPPPWSSTKGGWHGEPRGESGCGAGWRPESPPFPF